MRARGPAEGRLGVGERIWRARGTKVSPRWRQTRTPLEGALPGRVVFVVDSGRRKPLDGAKRLHTRRQCTGMLLWPPLHL